MASPGFCNPEANLTCSTGFTCKDWETVPTAVGAPTGYCTPLPTPAELCTAGGCDTSLNVCYLTNADPPPAFESCGDPMCTSSEDCAGNPGYECLSAQSGAIGAPTAYPVDAKTCMPPVGRR